MTWVGIPRGSWVASVLAALSCACAVGARAAPPVPVATSAFVRELGYRPEREALPDWHAPLTLDCRLPRAGPRAMVWAEAAPQLRFWVLATGGSEGESGLAVRYAWTHGELACEQIARLPFRPYQAVMSAHGLVVARAPDGADAQVGLLAEDGFHPLRAPTREAFNAAYPEGASRQSNLAVHGDEIWLGYADQTAGGTDAPPSAFAYLRVAPANAGAAPIPGTWQQAWVTRGHGAVDPSPRLREPAGYHLQVQHRRAAADEPGKGDAWTCRGPRGTTALGDFEWVTWFATDPPLAIAFETAWMADPQTVFFEGCDVPPILSEGRTLSVAALGGAAWVIDRMDSATTLVVAGRVLVQSRQFVQVVVVP